MLTFAHSLICSRQLGTLQSCSVNMLKHTQVLRGNEGATKGCGNLCNAEQFPATFVDVKRLRFWIALEVLLAMGRSRKKPRLALKPLLRVK